MTFADPVIPAEQMTQLLDVSRLHDQAKADLKAAGDEAIRLKASAKVDGRAQGLADGCAAAAELLAEAERQVIERAEGLEETLAKLVAETVRRIIGQGDWSDTVRAAVRTSLERMSTKETHRLHISPDMAAPVHAALADIEKTLTVLVDESLPEGTALLSTDQGHAHIGLEAQLSAGLAAFEGTQ